MSTEKRLLALILLIFLLLGAVYAVVTPPFEASDELWHYPMVRHLADGNPLPVQVTDPTLAGPWKQEASQPPLYYYIGAALTFWVDTADMNDVRIENPHVDNGILTRDGNINLVMHNPDAGSWTGTLLAVRLVRLLSVLMGAGTVLLTYHIASHAVPGRPEIALGAAAVNAFLPMFLFISAAVNNDNLAMLLSSAALLIMILIVMRSPEMSRPAWQRWTPWLALGAVIGLALLTKEGTIGLLPLALGTCFLAAWQRGRGENAPAAGSRRSYPAVALRSLLLFAAVLIPVVVVAGWWYWRNVVLYGDWLGWNAFIAVLGQRGHPASLAQLWGERRGFMMAYWGLFGGVNVPMPGWVYAVFDVLLIAAVVGFAVYLVAEVRRWAKARPMSGGPAAALDTAVQFVVDHFALVAALLFAATVVSGLIRWATTTWSSQGRLVFTAISALSTLFIVGLVGRLPQRAARPAAGVVGAWFLLISAVAPFLWIGPRYDPSYYDVLYHAGALQEQDHRFDESLWLRGAAVESERAGSPLNPGDGFWVHLDWEVTAPVSRPWSIFVHAVDPAIQQPIAQRDMYPGQGLQLTPWLAPGTRLKDSYFVQLPPTVIAPSELQIVAGLYDAVTGERLRTENGEEMVTLGTLEVEPASGEMPNPVDINFEDQLRLRGFEVQPRAQAAGQAIDLTLYWQADRPLANDYTFFAQVVDEDTTRWASADVGPAEGTAQWQPGQVQELSMELLLDPAAPSGVYPLIVGMYTQNDDGSFDRLQIQTDDGRLTDDFLELTRVRVEGS